MGDKQHQRLFPGGRLLLLCLLLPIFSNTDLTAQVTNDDCSTATNIFGDTYGQFFCLEGTTKDAKPDSVSFSPCFNSGFSTVWYKITDLYAELHFSLQVKGGEDDIFMLQLFGSPSDCDELFPLPVTINEQYCVLSLNSEIDLVGKPVEWQNYYVAVTGMDNDGVDFTICLNAMLQDIQCGVGKELTVTRNIDVETPQQPFFTGETLNITMNVNSFNSAGNGCQWFQGLVPVFGSGWDSDSYDAAGEPIFSTLNGHSTYEPNNGVYGNTTWSWFTDVDYHVGHLDYQVADFDGDGSLDICHGLYQKDCFDVGGLQSACCSPCWGAPKGTTLPGGWFAYGINGSCPLTGPPVGVDWGDGGTCGINYGPWDFEFQMKIKPGYEFQCDPEEVVDELTLGFFTFADGEIGAWTGPAYVCSYNAPIVETLPVVCIDGSTAPEIIEIYACVGDTVVIKPTEYEPLGSIRFWGIFSSSPYLNFSEGYLPGNDSLTFIASNPSGTNPNHISFLLYGYTSPQSLRTIRRFDIIVYPEPKAGFTYTLNENKVHFRSNHRIDTSFIWNFGDSTFSTLRDPVHSYTQNGVYEVQQIVTNYCGSDTAYQTVEISLSPIADFTKSPDVICQGDTLFLTSTFQDPQFTYLWLIEGGQPNAIDQPEIWVVYSDTGQFDVGLIVSNTFGSDTMILDSGFRVHAHVDITYDVEIYDSLYVFNFTGHQDQYVEWWLEDSLLFAGPTAQHIFDSSGTYKITIKAYNDCGTDSIRFSLVILTVSAHNLQAENRITISPNPATDWIRLICDKGIRIKRIALYDSFGHQVLEEKDAEWNDPYLLTGLGHLPRGLYILAVELDGRFIYKKFILQ